MISVQLLTSTTLVNETRMSSPVLVPVGLSSFRAWIDITQMVTPDQWFEYRIELSLDGGASWNLLMAGTRTGGIQVNPKTGFVITQAMLGCPLPEPQNVQRQIRGSMRVTGSVPLAVLVEAV